MKTFFDDLSKAESIANQMNDEDTGWTYKAIKLENSKYSVVLVYDEDGFLLGFL